MRFLQNCTRTANPHIIAYVYWLRIVDNFVVGSIYRMVVCVHYLTIDRYYDMIAYRDFLDGVDISPTSTAEIISDNHPATFADKYSCLVAKGSSPSELQNASIQYNNLCVFLNPYNSIPWQNDLSGFSNVDGHVMTDPKGIPPPISDNNIKSLKCYI